MSLPIRAASIASLWDRALLWLGIAALGAGAWLSLPRARVGACAPLEIVLVDVSKSAVSAEGARWPGRVEDTLLASARLASGAGLDMTVVAFGRDVRSVIPPMRARDVIERVESSRFDLRRDLFEEGARDGARETRLAAALELAGTLAAGRPRARVSIVGDGTCTGRDPAPAVEALRRAGVAIESSVPRRSEWNLALGPLQVARAVEVGAPLVVTVEARYESGLTRDRGARVEFSRRDAGGEARFVVELPLVHALDSVDSRPSTVTLHADLGPAIPGVIDVTARAVLLGTEASEPIADAMPEDDQSAASVRCAGSLVVGVVDAQGSGKPLYDLWHGADAGIEVRALERGELATNLASLDAVVTVDAPLADEEARLLVSFVAHGGGWLDVPGWNWIPERAAGRTPLAPIAALEPSKNALAPRDVVFLVDASGSMSGSPFEEVRRALVPLIDAALPVDDVSVRFFAADVSPPIRFGTGQDRSDREGQRSLAERVRTEREPGGATRLWVALQTLVREHQGSNRDALVLLLSDGQDPDRTEAAQRALSLRTELGAARMRLVAISPTQGADSEFLRSLTDSVTSMPGAGADGQPNWSFVFKRELARDAVRQRSNQPVLPVLGGSDLAAPIARAMGNVPPVDVVVRADLRPGAQVLWAGEDGSPLGAIFRAGTGLVATLAFAPDTQWAIGWTDPRTLAPLVRALARGHAEQPNGPNLTVEGDRLVLDGVDASYAAALPARARSTSGVEFELAFEAGRQGFDPITTRTAIVPEDLASSAIGFVLVRFDMAGKEPLELAAALPRAPEFAFETQHCALSAEAAAGPDRPGTIPTAHWLAPWMVLAGVLMLSSSALIGAFSRRRA